MVPERLIPSRLAEPYERVVRWSDWPEPTRLRSARIVLGLVGLVLWVVFRRLVGRRDDAELGVRTRRFLERSGPLWIKIGRLLALRRGIFPTEFCIELAQLRDLGPRVPAAASIAIVEEELGQPFESIFDGFEESPFASTTIAQIHRAHLLVENVWVALKVQHPHAADNVRNDLRLIRQAAWLLEFLAIRPEIRWKDFYLEVAEAMQHELDFRLEESNLRRFAKSLRPHRVYVPKVFSKYCERRVLVTEFIHAALMSDVVELQKSDPARLEAWFRANNISPKRIARRLFHSVYRQIFEDNFFHPDMHPGNIILLRNSRIAVLDCRMAASVERENLDKLRLLQFAVIEERYATAADLFFLLAVRLPRVELAEVKTGLVRCWRFWAARTRIEELPYSEKSLTKILDELNQLTFRYGFELQWGLSRLVQAWNHLDLSLERLSPEINYLKFMRRYFVKAKQRTGKIVAAMNMANLPEAFAYLKKLPRAQGENSFYAQILIRRQTQVIQGSTNKFSYAIAVAIEAAAVALSVVVAVLFFAFLDQHVEDDLDSVIGANLATVSRIVGPLSFWEWIIILGIGLVVIYRMFDLRRKFLRREVRVPEPAISV